ncbi:MAG: hypothetical protein HZC17_07255 [Candidatus Omnitrophica bacterium]|nr:hypothetical protein [Candidatus Omnitrophota bacterium]
MDRLAADAPLDIRSSKIGVIVNVYGDKDVLATLDVLGEKVGGYRDDIGKYVVDDRNRPLVNVEILGANHFDYMRRADLSPTQSVGFGGSYGIGVTLANVLNTGNLGAYDGPLNFGKVLYDLTTEKDRKWNEAVSEFVARLTLNSKTSDDLDAFLRSLGPEIANFDNMQRKWVITLSGWEARK